MGRTERLTDTGRDRLVEAATELVREVGPGVTTRRVYERAGVTAPTLYHHFGDRRGLLDAVVETAFALYWASKDAVTVTGDPAVDARQGWDAHVGFALADPKIHPLLFPGDGERPAPAARVTRHVRDAFDRLAETGGLRPGMTGELATRVTLAGLRGVTAAIVAEPNRPDNTTLSRIVRDAVTDAVLAEPGEKETG